MDVWSRKITGWSVELCEDGKIGADLMAALCKKYGIENLILHSDNGGPMKCGTMLATLQWLGVAPSFSRPGVSNDNPFSESLFKTMKYRPAYPSEFKTIEEARAWVAHFVSWYNTEHHHSGIRYVTPQERHSGADIVILEKRKETYRLAQMKRPDRWSRGTRNWNQITEVVLNRTIETVEMKKCA
jgi:putative transposase